MKGHMPRLEQWSVRADQWTGGFVPPDSELKFLHGVIMNDSFRPDRDDLLNNQFSDGDHVHTSRVASIDLANKKAQTRNTLYDLGEPSPAYVKWCAERGIELIPVAAEAAAQ